MSSLLPASSGTRRSDLLGAIMEDGEVGGSNGTVWWLLFDKVAWIPIGDGNRCPEGGDPFSLTYISLDIPVDDMTVDGAVVDKVLTISSSPLPSFVPEWISCSSDSLFSWSIALENTVEITSSLKSIPDAVDTTLTSKPITTGIPILGVVAAVVWLSFGLIPTILNMALTARNGVLAFRDVGVSESSDGTAAAGMTLVSLTGSSASLTWKVGLSTISFFSIPSARLVSTWFAGLFFGSDSVDGGESLATIEASVWGDNNGGIRVDDPKSTAASDTGDCTSSRNSGSWTVAGISKGVRVTGGWYDFGLVAEWWTISSCKTTRFNEMGDGACNVIPDPRFIFIGFISAVPALCWLTMVVVVVAATSCGGTGHDCSINVCCIISMPSFMTISAACTTWCTAWVAVCCISCATAIPLSMLCLISFRRWILDTILWLKEDVTLSIPEEPWLYIPPV